MISIEDFLKIDLRVAEVKHAEPHPNADKLLILKIDAGDGLEGRQIVAGIRGAYNPEDLVGKKIVIVNNLAPATLRGVESQGMLQRPVLGIPDLASGGERVEVRKRRSQEDRKRQ